MQLIGILYCRALYLLVKHALEITLICPPTQPFTFYPPTQPLIYKYFAYTQPLENSDLQESRTPKFCT